MVHDLPSVRFATVDVRHAPVDAYRLVSYSRLAMLGAQGVRGVLGYGNHDHVVQRHLPPENAWAACSQEALTSSHPSIRPPNGCMAETSEPCDQISSIGPLSPSSARFRAA